MTTYVDVSEQRPDNDDMKLMSRLIAELLLYAREATEPVPVGIADTPIDVEALTYTAILRADTIAKGTGVASDIHTSAAIALGWTEGLLLGVRFAEEKGKQDEK